MFATEFQTVKVIPLGGGWAFAVGYIDGGRVRVSKGKLKEGDGCPVSQVQRMNFKNADEARQVLEEVIKAFEQRTP